jgi:DNA-binding transcriptional ArsR family regulator
MKPYRDITDPTVAKALAHPLRTRILTALEGRTASPSELAAELEAPLGVLSYHVRRLSALGLVKLVRRVPRRGAVEHYYTAQSRPRITDEAWGSVPAVIKEATVSAALGQIGSLVSSAAAGGGFDAPEAHLTRNPVTVDELGWRELGRELDALAERIRTIAAESAQRLRSDGHQAPRHASAVLMLFEEPTAAAVSDGAAAAGPEVAVSNVGAAAGPEVAVSNVGAAAGPEVAVSDVAAVDGAGAAG